MFSNNWPTYSMDVVHCVDVNKKMLPEIERVKQQIKRFHMDLMDDLPRKNRALGSFRVRLIAFSDVGVDQKDAVMLTDFYELPRENNSFSSALSSISCSIGGGDDYNNGLEALAYAIRSKWKTHGNSKKRQIIAVWSNGTPRPLGTSKEFFSPRMAKDFGELTEWWLDMPDTRRLLILAPQKSGWTDIAEHWPETIMYPSSAGEGMHEREGNAIIATIYDL